MSRLSHSRFTHIIRSSREAFGVRSACWLSVSQFLLVAQLMLFVTCLRAASDPGGAAFDSANKLYEQGKFTEAASAYEKMVQTGQASAAVYYNLGNAFFKAGQIGRAIAAYNAAEK